MKTVNDIQAESASDLLHNSKTVMFRMQGNSMYPILRDGEIGIVRKCNPEDLKIGDIVVFKSENKYIAHRLIRIENQGLKTYFIAQGLNNRHTDAPFSSENLAGKMISYTRNGKVKTFKDMDARWNVFYVKYLKRFFFPLINSTKRLKVHGKNLFDSLKSLRGNLKIIGKGTKKPFLQNALIAVLQGILPFFLIICIKLLIDTLTTPSDSTDWSWNDQRFLIILTALVFLFNALITVFRGYFMEKLAHIITHRTYELLHKKHSELDLSSYEDPSQQDKIHRAIQEAGFRPVKIINSLLTLIKAIISVLFMLILFASIQWYLVLILLIAIIPSILAQLKYSNKRYRLKESQSPLERKNSYFNRILTGMPFAKELRLFGFSNNFLQRFLTIEDTLYEEKIDLQRSELQANIIAQIFAVLLIFTSLAYVVYLKTTGAVSIGSVVLFFFVFQRGFSVFTELFTTLTSLVEDNVFLNDFIDFLNYPVTNKSSIKTPLNSLKKGITVKNLRFKYETSKRDALSSVNLYIPAGKTVAFVGANGSGKTTLIKLLCGFYTPLEGSILYDDTDISTLNKEALREQITAVFQDFALYNISANENIGLGDIHKPFNLEKAKKAAEAAGISKILELLPDGYETLLGNLFKSGEDLSIGQWQKVAIARAFYRDSPIVFMDEPSSALDVESEKQLLESLKMLSKDKTVVIISHRLTTVQWADLIYVFDQGQVLESGSHQQLMDLKGAYSELFLKTKI